jgi:DNA replication protein DnaC
VSERMTSIGEAADAAVQRLTVGPPPPPIDPPAPPDSRSPDDKLRDALRRAGVPDRFLDCSLDGFEEVAGIGKAKQYAQACIEKPGGLLLIGKAGSGKTHLAVGVLRGIALRRHPVDPHFESFRSRFVVVPEFLDQLRERISDPSVPDPLPDLEAAPLLILDDLGREKPTPWVTDRLYVLINHRYNRMRPTIATTNYPLSELADRGYDAMVSRLRESAKVLTLTATDYRKAA